VAFFFTAHGILAFILNTVGFCKQILTRYSRPMVRSVQIDEAVQQYADQRMLKRAQAEVNTSFNFLIV
jgi:hypothetical protein